MTLALTAAEALWFLPFVLPICIWVAWSDLREMRIPNVSVLALAGVFLAVGLIALPFEVYYMRQGRAGGPPRDTRLGLLGSRQAISHGRGAGRCAGGLPGPRDCHRALINSQFWCEIAGVKQKVRRP